MNKGICFVAMSGGVDSSAAAALLLEQGYAVTGVTMLLDESGRQAVRDARAVCDFLKIPHVVLDLQSEFRRLVVAPFMAAYLGGQTPNPCVTCNRRVKFGVLLERCFALGADFVATGHYADLVEAEGKRYLQKSAGGVKDQTYFLYSLNQAQLARVMFPLARLCKEEVRDFARERGLPVYQKPDSQEICFVEGNHGDYIAGLSAMKSGEFVLESGEIIGRHRGLAYYTIGQRKGLGIAWAYPLFVLRLDAEKNQVVLGKEEALFATTLLVEEPLFAGDFPKAPLSVTAKIRYGGSAAPALVTPLSPLCLRLEFETPQRAITPGQAAVFYQGDRLLGGGTIAGVLTKAED